jgi:tetratricopeptide (TPR) repeat protein
LVAPPAVLAAGAGGGGGGSTGFGNRDTTPGQRAILQYRTGEKRLDQARQIQQELVAARAADDEAKARALEAKAERAYSRAERDYRKALEYDEDLHQAWSSLGYTLRHLGRFDEALAAYDKALALEPRYAEAVEYRAEAYLELGRIEEAKAGYLELVGWVPPLADRLMAKMSSWAHARAVDPAGLAPADVAAFARWIDERREIDGEPEAFSAADRARW